MDARKGHSAFAGSKRPDENQNRLLGQFLLEGGGDSSERAFDRTSFDAMRTIYSRKGMHDDHIFLGS
jgi:hypothetical protein